MEWGVFKVAHFQFNCFAVSTRKRGSVGAAFLLLDYVMQCERGFLHLSDGHSSHVNVVGMDKLVWSTYLDISEFFFKNQNNPLGDADTLPGMAVRRHFLALTCDRTNYAVLFLPCQHLVRSNHTRARSSAPAFCQDFVV